jgi:hypothetical protein
MPEQGRNVKVPYRVIDTLFVLLALVLLVPLAVQLWESILVLWEH